MSIDLTQELRVLQKDFEAIAESLERVAAEVIENRVTRYPVFIASEQPVQLGLPIVNRDDFGLRWNYNISIIEEFVKKGLIDAAALPQFKRAYLDPLEKACVFLVLPNGSAHFVFVPYYGGQATVAN